MFSYKNNESKIDKKNKTPAIVRCVGILNFIEKHKNCTVGDLITNLKLPRSSAYILIETMQEQGLIKINEDGSIQLWMKLIELGQAASNNLNIREIVTPHLNNLLESIDCLAVHYGVLEGVKGYYVIKIPSPRASMSIMSREGLEISLVHAGIGKCLLAFQDERKRAQILPLLDFTPITKTSISNKSDFLKELATIRLQGWAFDNSEGEDSIRCVAVPIFAKSNQIIGAISIVGVVNKYTDEVIPKIVEKTKQCAKNIEKDLNNY